MRDERRLVYSTDGSLPLPKPAARKAAPRAKDVPPSDGFLRVGCERRRNGWITLIYGLAHAEIETVAGELKRRCASGGTVKGAVLELQGDHRDAVLSFFSQAGRRAKRMGG